MQKPLQRWAADFSHLQPQWLFVRQPDMESYAFSPEGVTLTPSRVRISDPMGSPTMMAVRPLDIDCTVEADFDFEPLCEGDEAGISIYISHAGI